MLAQESLRKSSSLFCDLCTSGVLCWVASTNSHSLEVEWPELVLAFSLLLFTRFIWLLRLSRLVLGIVSSMNSSEAWWAGRSCIIGVLLTSLVFPICYVLLLLKSIWLVFKCLGLSGMPYFSLPNLSFLLEIMGPFPKSTMETLCLSRSL